MTEDERQRQMDFILNQQAQFAADIQKLQEGHAKLQEGQARLQESQAETVRLVDRLAAVTLEGFKQTNEAHKRTEESLNKLAEAQAHTDQRLDALIDIVRKRLEGNS